MPASIEPVLSLLRCPECGAGLGEDLLSTPGVRCTAGHHFDLIAGRAPDLARQVVQRDSPGQWAMRFRPLVRIYESAWRPLFTAAAGGTEPDRETAQLLGWIDPSSGASVLDVACGPGNTTRRLAAGIPDGEVIGVDLSVPMLEEAVRCTDAGSGVGFARVDVHRLPVDDASVDAAHCAAALYLVADPAAVIAEIARVLCPGGRFVGMTIVSPLRSLRSVPGFAEDLLSKATGMRYFGPDELEAMCTAAGLEHFRTTRRGASLLFAAERPG